MNNYEASEVFNVGNAHELILGDKAIDPTQRDSVLGQGFVTLPTDIDEGE